MSNLEERFLGVRVNTDAGKPALHKPLLLLFALGQLLRYKKRTFLFSEIDAGLSVLLQQFFPQGSKNINTHYPFGKLENDGIWEIERSNELKRTSVGHLMKPELLSRNIHGGFTHDVLNELGDDNSRIISIAKKISDKYFQPENRINVLQAVGLEESFGPPFKEIEADSYRFRGGISMALIDTQTFTLTRQRLITALSLISNTPDIFSAGRMREARVAFISGKNVISSIRGWLLAAKVINNGTKSQYLLTDYGKRLLSVDPKMQKASSWWSLHLNICLSDRCDPYRALFYVLGEHKDYIAQDELLTSKLSAIINDNHSNAIANASIETNLAGVIKMFTGESPLSDLGLLDTLDNKSKIRLGDPFVTDQAIGYGLALARHRFFATRTTVNFREFVDFGFHHFLCLSVNDLRNRLRELSRSAAWQQHFSFIEGKDLDSIQFGDRLNPNQTLLQLLQESEDTWL